jgi:ankyrin repeat protein
MHTPLLVACRDGHEAIVTELLKAGADVNAVEPTFGAVPLHKAVYNGHAGITQMLVQQPGIDLNFQGWTNGYTPLHDALWHGFVDCARILVEAGARLDLKGHDGKLPIDIATEVFGKEDKEMVALLRSRM